MKEDKFEVKRAYLGLVMMYEDKKRKRCLLSKTLDRWNTISAVR